MKVKVGVVVAVRVTVSVGVKVKVGVVVAVRVTVSVGVKVKVGVVVAVRTTTGVGVKVKVGVVVAVRVTVGVREAGTALGTGVGVTVRVTVAVRVFTVAVKDEVAVAVRVTVKVGGTGVRVMVGETVMVRVRVGTGVAAPTVSGVWTASINPTIVTVTRMTRTSIALPFMRHRHRIPGLAPPRTRWRHAGRHTFDPCVGVIVAPHNSNRQCSRTKVHRCRALARNLGVTGSDRKPGETSAPGHPRGAVARQPAIRPAYPEGPRPQGGRIAPVATGNRG